LHAASHSASRSPAVAGLNGEDSQQQLTTAQGKKLPDSQRASHLALSRNTGFVRASQLCASR
jgi:hypothetical protein